MAKGSDLVKNATGYIKCAELAYNLKEYNSATVLYFKALFALLDYKILASEHEVPKDHTARFRVLEKKFPDDYAFLDRVFPEYQRSYSLSVNKNVCEEVRSYVLALSRDVNAVQDR